MEDKTLEKFNEIFPNVRTLSYCGKCNSMTNHLNNQCLRCVAIKTDRPQSDETETKQSCRMYTQAELDKAVKLARLEERNSIRNILAKPILLNEERIKELSQPTNQVSEGK